MEPKAVANIAIPMDPRYVDVVPYCIAAEFDVTEAASAPPDRVAVPAACPDADERDSYVKCINASQ